MGNEFRINNNLSDVSFIANRETGKWVISNKSIKNIREKVRVPFNKVNLKGVESIVLNMGRPCNFNCGYCLVGDLREDIDQLSKKVGMKTIERMSEMKQKKKELVFHGSEPMINYKLLKSLVKYGQKVDKNIRFCVQSNESLFTDKRIEFLAENKIDIGISLDGLREHQNETRPYKDGGETYDIVKESILKIKKTKWKNFGYYCCH